MYEEQYDGAFWYAIAAGLLLTVAAAVRIHLLGTTLFEDEVWVARLIRDGGLEPHTYTTPPLFYAIGRFWASIRGLSDVALREPPAFFGVALCAVPLAAPRDMRVRFIWALLLAFSSPLLFYSTRVKQYTLEAFVAAVLVVLFLRAYEGESLLAWIGFFAVGIAGVLTLFSPVFIIAAAGAIVVFSRRVRNAPLIIAFLVTGALAVFAYFAYTAPGPTTPMLHGDMDAFFSAHGRWVNSPASFMANSKEWLSHAMNLVPFWWAVVIVLGALWLFVQRDVPVIVLAALPPLAVVAASVARKYPYGEIRLMMFCFPALYLAVAESLAAVSRRVPLLLLVLVPFAVNGIARDPYNAAYMHVDDMHTIIATIKAGHHANEPIYADLAYAAVLDYYEPSLQRDIHAGVVHAPSSPGWYVQRRSQFTPANAAIVVRQGDVVAAHVP